MNHKNKALPVPVVIDEQVVCISWVRVAAGFLSGRCPFALKKSVTWKTYGYLFFCRLIARTRQFAIPSSKLAKPLTGFLRPGSFNVVSFLQFLKLPNISANGGFFLSQTAWRCYKSSIPGALTCFFW